MIKITIKILFLYTNMILRRSGRSEVIGKRKKNSDFPNKLVINDAEIILIYLIFQQKNIFHHILMSAHLYFKKLKLRKVNANQHF